MEDNRSVLHGEAPASGEPTDARPEKRKRTRKRGRVTVFENWCKGCGLCIAFCPQKVLASGPDGHTIVAHGEKCVACDWCYEHCPDCAIVVEAYMVEEEVAPAGRQVAEVAG